MTGNEIREMFLAFFEGKGHRRVPSSSLVPANDPTLLFTNAGMNQFKDVFLGLEKREYNRATTAQKCVRAGGKHNDLENVGFTNRHHTFFEMLGNFSFGDYFKKEAIAYAWELVTSPKWFGIPKDKLYFTIFQGEGDIPRDSDAEKFWLEVGAPKERVYAMGMKDNFWAMGETGPCGPCSEIHYDMGPTASDQGHADCKFGCECGRYVEIWNLVFMQFDRDSAGKLNQLPKPCVDTGAGLERVTAVLQGKISNYDTDLFVPLMRHAAQLCGVDLEKELKTESKTKSAASLRVIADHARACTFLLSDGVLPSNDGRGYVLRKILRRGIRHGRLLGANKPFMYEMAHAVRNLMKDAYPELIENAERVSKVIYEEERRFAHTLELGLIQLEQDLTEAEHKMGPAKVDVSAFAITLDSSKPAAGFVDSVGKRFYKGERAFKLYDTFGLPRDFIEDACRDRGVTFDSKGFDRAMAEQRERARASWKGGTKNPHYALQGMKPSVFEGYSSLESLNCEVLAMIPAGEGLTGIGEAIQHLQPGQTALVVLDHTPFYADSGGQVGDIGWFYEPGTRALVAEVHGCVAPVQGVRAHKVTAKQAIQVGMKLDAAVNAEVRAETMRNHTATHLLHAALRETLGKHVKQAGSLVDPRHLRFDFSHFTHVADEELQDIEDLTNKEVLKNTRVEVIPDVPIDVAINDYKAMALFGEKYGELVRVVKIGDFSTELCGGTHTAQTGEIGLVKILSEGSVSSGVRRVEAVTGEGSLKHFRKDHNLERVVRQHVRANVPVKDELIHGPHAVELDESTLAQQLVTELSNKDEEIKKLKKELDQARMKSAAAATSHVEDQVRVVNGIKVLAQRVDNLERGQMRTLVDNLRNKLGSGVVVLGSVSEVESEDEAGAKIKEKKVALIVGVTKDLTAKIQAGKIIAPIAKKVGGSGGGRPDMAEAGGKDAAALDAALAEAAAVVGALTK